MDPATTSSRSASYVLPAHFEERIIRIYHKREVEDDHDVKQAVSEAFRCFLDRQNLGSAPRWSPPPTPMFPDIDSESNVAECGDSRVLKRMKPDLGKTGE